jgi:hypothetical protein|tara:strand:+ start:985 stop:1257 length:273 start_codon:yes stop_codon:yes gene_type:complete
MQEAPLMENYIDDEGEFDFTTFISDNEKWMMQVRSKRVQSSLFENYGITEEQWKNTPIKVQSVIIELIHESELFAETMQELEEWRDSMPI